MTMTQVKDAEYPLHRVEHFRQRWHWDCGVSCVLMVLCPEKKNQFLKEFPRICHEEGLEESTWTIDLCYLLKRFEVPHRMYTTLAAVNEDYRKHKYYSNVIDKDRSRVEGRFQQAGSSGIEVREQLLTPAELVAHLRSGPAILLVDGSLLACDLCKHNKLKAEFRSCFGGSYKGHYILALGYCRSRVWYRDPALPSRLCAASRTRLCRAAHAPATDDDAILIYTNTRTTDVK